MELTRRIQYESELNRNFTEQLARIEGGQRIRDCIQCGTCSGTCPVSIYMDYTPRRLIAMAREGFEAEVLRSRTIWICSSCYSCTVRCPRKIGITDLMYAFKRRAIERKIYPKKFPIPILAREFHDLVRDLGRNPETRVALRMALKSEPSVLLGMTRMGWHLLRTGRMRFAPDAIRGRQELRELLGAIGGPER